MLCRYDNHIDCVTNYENSLCYPNISKSVLFEFWLAHLLLFALVSECVFLCLIYLYNIWIAVSYCTYICRKWRLVSGVCRSPRISNYRSTVRTLKMVQIVRSVTVDQCGVWNVWVNGSLVDKINRDPTPGLAVNHHVLRAEQHSVL